MTVGERTIEDFLDDAPLASEIDWSRPSGAPLAIDPLRVAFGHGPNPLEVAIAAADVAPRMDDVRRLWSLRWGRRASPVLLVVGYPTPAGWRATVCGPDEDSAAVTGLDLYQCERATAAALAESNPTAAKRTLGELLASTQDQLVAGLTNQGLFASHELRYGVPTRQDWQRAGLDGQKLLGKAGSELISALGYTTTALGSVAQLLSVEGRQRAIAVLLTETELFDRPGQRFGAASPAGVGLALAQEHNLPWLILVKGKKIRLYPARPDVGVGRKGQSETYVEINLTHLASDDAAYLSLLFGATALCEGGTVAEILNASIDHATGLGERLRERVYVDVVPSLAVAVANSMREAKGAELDDADLHEAYHRTLIILFRLLFVAYAEDRGLLPYNRNPRYTKKALKTVAREFANDAALKFDSSSSDRWVDLQAIWRAVDDGNREWGVPAYNGGLFNSDAHTHPSGHAISQMRLTNDQIGPALRSLLIDTSADGGEGPVDFRALSVREFGTIYEGLLESSLSIAPQDLAVDPNSLAFVPASPHDEVAVAAGSVYFHNSSGERKSTGSYFTKAFAVEHLLDSSLEPALYRHLQRVERLIHAGDEATASEAFFDFRAIDLAMGSGHFLVAAIDRIEVALSKFLADHPIPAVVDELSRLAATAEAALGENAAHVEIEPSMLLRRQVARRCIYGLDLNRMAVELARLAIWIHTFVPGLPMSSLDHGLRIGNSLTGIGTVDEALAVFEPRSTEGQYSLFGEQIETALSNARGRLLRVARTAEATKAEVREAAREHTKAMSEAAEAKLLLDAAVAIRLGQTGPPPGVGEALALGRSPSTIDAVDRLQAVHLPYLFPEVFARDDPGFDVILGNPPWEKVRWEPTPYWVGVSPGLNALRDRDRAAAIEELRRSRPTEHAHELVEQSRRLELQDYFKTVYTLRGGTHLELAQLMLERALRVLRRNGSLGLVLPRQSMVLAGWKNLRKAIVGNYDLDIVQGRNQGEWIFEDVHASYAVVLLSAGPSSGAPINVWVATSPAEISAISQETAIRLSVEDLDSYSENKVIPWFASADDRTIFDTMRSYPRVAQASGWFSGRHDARWDFRGTGPDRDLAERVDSDGAWRVLMTAHVDAYAFDDSVAYKQYVGDLHALTARGRGILRSDAGQVLADSTHPVLLVRHPSRSDDTRTLIATALPETGILHNKGYVHAIAHADGTGVAERLAMLGLLNSHVLDWWARRFVDRHVTAPVINQLVLPNWSPADIERVAGAVCLILATHGSRRLAGGIDVIERSRAAPADLKTMSTFQLEVEIEALALSGFGLGAEQMITISNDFSPRGLSPDFLEAVSKRLSERTISGPVV
ncbi:Eco57I restriction-modification methylase domain-containing protein [Pseudonocardia sp. WMMC193]|uniref:Eco57I restriction-modification methylase domain-containing protein n=1 Tax=Pseudonocardia sp. WMMC193 TaxID=2911965 RepID=UPI001F15C43F|nr:hypothetical protein [Pseudonocardia sp. WMMC193]MCF7547352.1 hypothetical protein [Pseudonocardia sp. WMMC193]